MYGYDDKTYKIFTGVSEGYSFLERTVDKANHHNVSIMLSIIINKNYYLELENYIISAIDMHAPSITFGLSVPIGRINLHQELFTFNDTELLKLYENVIKIKFSQMSFTI